MIRRKLISVLLPCALLLVNGCYLLKQGTYVLRYSNRAKPIKAILKDPDTPREIREFLLSVEEIRQFAIDSVGLKQNRNYTRYVHTDRTYLVNVVSACRDDSFEQHKWCWPFFGCFPYKGFFDREDAVRESLKVSERGGYDVYIGKADGFSMLGYISDPVYSFMKNLSPFSLASLIIHEQTHATLFLKNQVQFNEELASFIGDQGGLAYIASKFGEDSEQYREAKLSLRDYQAFVAQLRALHRDLKNLYARSISREQKLREKQETLINFKAKIAADYDSVFATNRYRGLDKLAINNAYIAARMTYTLDLQDYYELYERNNRDLRATVIKLKSLRSAGDDPKKYLREVLLK